MKKNDIILVAVIMAVTLVLICGMRLWQRNNTNEAAVAVVTVDGEVYGTYPLAEDVTEKIEFPDGSYNILKISEGYADVTEASCPDQICVKHNRIKYAGEAIICLPNKLVVQIEGGDENGIDGSTH